MIGQPKTWNDRLRPVVRRIKVVLGVALTLSSRGTIRMVFTSGLLLAGSLRASSPPPQPSPTAQDSHSSPVDSVRVDTLRHARFGNLVLYHPQRGLSQVVLFVSGDGGWNRGVRRMAKELAGMGALVVGIDIRRYLGALESAKGPCSYPAADFESLSQWVQQKLSFSSYLSPTLVGYSSGASLIYATLAQSPPGTFLSGLSLGFNAELSVKRRLCRGTGLISSVQARSRGQRFAPSGSIPAPWIVLQGAIDSSASPGQAREFVGRIRGARIVLLPGVGHGFGVTSRWLPQFRAAFSQLARTTGPDLSTHTEVGDLPLVEVGARNRNGEVAIVVSGDGGWAGIDRQIGETFANEGIPVVGLNSLKYFWKARTPDQAGADLTRLVRHYLRAWDASRVLLVGYSRGADVLPFMASRLAPDLRNRVRVVALLGLSLEAGFEFHFADLLGGGKGMGRPTLPEIRRLRGLRVLCVYGTDENDTACRDLPANLAMVVGVPGGHHFGGAYREVASRILQIAQGH
jgi:type IV secretory pathway VirJ component